MSPVSIIICCPNGPMWIPCHNVILYDLEQGEMVDAFTAVALRPDTVIATSATFAPDGKSLLCAVFGDGGAWTMDSFGETTFYQIRLDDGSFDAVRIFRTNVQATPELLSWLENDTVLMRKWGAGRR